MSKKKKRSGNDLTTTVQVRLHPTPEQGRLLMAHCLEYISTVNVLVQALDADMLEKGFSTKDFTAALPSAIKNQALRDARSVFHRSLELGVIPVLKKPICQWNNQNWPAWSQCRCRWSVRLGQRTGGLRPPQAVKRGSRSGNGLRGSGSELPGL